MSTEAIPFDVRKKSTASSDLVGATYERMRSLIVTGRLSPGSRIIESDLADRLGVSRTPVRSALQRLQQEGFVTALDGGRNARLVVSPLTGHDARELISMLGAIEGLAARAVASFPLRQRKAIADDQRRLNDELERILRVERSIDGQEVFEVHSAFHATHMAAAGLPRVSALYASIQPQAERYRRVYITAAPTGLMSEMDEHQAIIKAIEDGDGPAAQMAVQENWMSASERLGEIVERLGDRGSW